MHTVCVCACVRVHVCTLYAHYMLNLSECLDYKQLELDITKYIAVRRTCCKKQAWIRCKVTGVSKFVEKFGLDRYKKNASKVSSLSGQV